MSDRLQKTGSWSSPGPVLSDSLLDKLGRLSQRLLTIRLSEENSLEAGVGAGGGMSHACTRRSPPLPPSWVTWTLLAPRGWGRPPAAGQALTDRPGERREPLSRS